MPESFPLCSQRRVKSTNPHLPLYLFHGEVLNDTPHQECGCYLQVKQTRGTCGGFQFWDLPFLRPHINLVLPQKTAATKLSHHDIYNTRLLSQTPTEQNPTVFSFFALGLAHKNAFAHKRELERGRLKISAVAVITKLLLQHNAEAIAILRFRETTHT
ncbi:jg4409 [Pararge aegeria aegeria]|uniref:Jg4409 protein n=1 Tax=Pararge aegeria aegeria TaxID=348720 RepID=A0A8S4RK91_9NEOP|nr:jg4409 [Pararge aegeria aegeria]